MKFDDIRQAVEARAFAWSDAPVELDGVPRSQAVIDAVENGEDWIRVTIQHGDSRTAEIGSRPIPERTGVIMCQVFLSQKSGGRAVSKPAADLADSLAQNFSYWQEGGLTTQAASARRVGIDGAWMQWNVSAPFLAR